MAATVWTLVYFVICFSIATSEREHNGNFQSGSGWDCRSLWCQLIASGDSSIVSQSLSATESASTPATIVTNARSENIQSYRDQCEANVRLAETCRPALPRYYVTHRKSGNITIDGRLDDPAWQSVPWTENFVDIRGVNFPAPREATHVKVIWDDTTIYVGARMQEEHVWATYRQKDTRIYQENAFEVFFDVDNSMSWYKEIEINALETTWDLQLSRAYIDGGDWMDWEGIAEKGVFTDGGVNNISNPSTYWSMEMAFPISRLVENTTRSNTSPKDGEYWFAIFARPEYQTRENTTTGQYEVVPGSETSWWSWNPTGATNLHLPNRWGLLYFSSKPAGSADFSDREVTFRNWSMYQGLFQLFEDVWTFKKLNNMFPDDQRLYKVPPFISDCFASYTVNVTEDGNGFTATLTALDNPLFKGSIDQNRKVTFTGA